MQIEFRDSSSGSHFADVKCDGKQFSYDEFGDWVNTLLSQLATAKEENQSFGNVLATVHLDGGHYITTHGHHKASRDAIKVVIELRAKLATAQKQLVRYEETEASVCPEDVGIKEYVASLIAKLDSANHDYAELGEEAIKQNVIACRLIDKLFQLQAENKRLKEFARPVIRTECWSLLEQDGNDIQKWALELGLIESYIVTAEQADDEFAPGDTKYRFSKVLKEID